MGKKAGRMLKKRERIWRVKPQESLQVQVIGFYCTFVFLDLDASGIELKLDLTEPNSGSFEFHICLLGSGWQDIRNLIPFSGKGFLLGGNSQSCASSPPSPNTCSSITISSPKKLLGLSPPTRTLGSPVRPNKPPVKRSVGNCEAFLSVSGSPVRIPKTNANKHAKTTQQKSIEDLFSLRKPSETPGTPASGTAKPSPSTSGGLSSAALIGAQRSPAEPADSPDLDRSSRKRTWDEHNKSASVSASFQKTISSDSSAVQQTGAAAASRVGPGSVQSSSAPCSPPSATLTVTCPVCQAKVEESKINEHLDSCLS